MAKEKRDVNVRKDADDPSGSRSNISEDMDRLFRRMKAIQILVAIVMLLSVLNFFYSPDMDSNEGAIIQPWKNIELDTDHSENDYVVKNVWLRLKNTGDETGRVGITGIVFMDEVATTVLKYQYTEVEPGETKGLNLGTFDQYTDWHYVYVIEVHVDWNGGSFTLWKRVVPAD